MRRTTWMGVILMLLLGAGALAQVKPQMPQDVGDGRAAWFDISTTDVAKAKEFYGKLFDWSFTTVAGTNQRSAPGSSRDFRSISPTARARSRCSSIRRATRSACIHVPGFPTRRLIELGDAN